MASAQRLYSPAAINVDFALITLKTPVTEGTGYFGVQRGSGSSNLDISSVRSPTGPARSRAVADICSRAAQQTLLIGLSVSSTS